MDNSISKHLQKGEVMCAKFARSAGSAGKKNTVFFPQIPQIKAQISILPVLKNTKLLRNS